MNAHKNFPKISRVFSMGTIHTIERSVSPKIPTARYPVSFFSVSAKALTISVAKRRKNDTRIPTTTTRATIPEPGSVEHQKRSAPLRETGTPKIFPVTCPILSDRALAMAGENRPKLVHKKGKIEVQVSHSIPPAGFPDVENLKILLESGNLPGKPA